MFDLTDDVVRNAAKAAYEGYCNRTGGKSLITRMELPTWDKLPANIQGAWSAAVAGAFKVFLSCVVAELESKVVMTREDHEKLLDKTLFLGCLQGAGVDNWAGYDEAISAYNELSGGESD